MVCMHVLAGSQLVRITVTCLFPLLSESYTAVHLAGVGKKRLCNV